MKKTMLVLVMLAAVVLSGCGNTKLEQENQNLRMENQTLITETQELKRTISQLQNELQILKETDQQYFNKGIDAFDKAQTDKSKDGFQSAINIFGQLIQKFPHSIYLAKAKEYSDISNKEISKIETIEKGKSNIEMAISERNYERSIGELNKLKGLIKPDEYKAISEKIYEAKNKPIEVSVRDLKAEPRKYFFKRVKVGPLKVMDNNIGRASFRTCPSTGKGFTDYDSDVSIEVSYRKSDNSSAWRNLSSDKRPIINVIGIFDCYFDSLDNGYIKADKIIQEEE
jgi:tetratricopeptide (TPR) repeat protein